MNEGYTLGKVLEYLLYEHYYKAKKELSYVGFRQHHPHDTDSMIRVAFHDDAHGEDESIYINKINNCLQDICRIGKSIFQTIHSEF